MGERDLRLLVRRLLEAAIKGKVAASQGLALLRSSKGPGVEYILYNPAKFYELAQGVPKDRLESIDPSEMIYGYLDVRSHKDECWNAAEIKFSAARKGFGPLMYELAMSDFGKIMSDHGSGSSPSARAVWQKYANRSDVETLPFDDVKNPKTPPKVDDCKIIPELDGKNSYLNAAYAGAGDSSGKTKMMRAHDLLVDLMVSDGHKKSDVELGLRMIADEYFAMRYGDNT
jgi:hypothetical protein